MALELDQPSSSQAHQRPPRTASRYSQNSSFEERVPSGTVGIRIHQLKTIAGREPSQIVVRSTSQRERANTRLGWGRRMDRSFAKPASRNTILVEEAMPNTANHSYLGPVVERKNHREGHGLSRSSMPESGHHQLGTLRQTTSITALKEKTDHQRHDSTRTEDGHFQQTFTSLRPRSEDFRPEKSNSSSIAPSSEVRLVDTAARHRDALKMFESHGISRPEGWLSEEDAFDDSSRHQTHHKTQVCHSCGEQLVGAQRFYGNCGHEACLKCQGEVTDSKSLCEHGHTHRKGNLGPQTPLFKQHKSHHGHGSGHKHRHKSHSADRGPATPRPRKLVVDSNIAEEEDLPHLNRKASTKTGFGGSGLVRDNPFFRGDRQRGEAATAQATKRNIQAHRQTHNSDCVPSRRTDGSSQSHLGHSGCRDLLYEATHSSHHQESNASEDQDKGKPCNGKQPENSHFDHAEDDFHSNYADSLEGKIDQLYHHGQDMHHSQHILEHLAAGAHNVRVKRKASETSGSHPVLPPKHHSYAGLRLHSLGQDEHGEVPHPSGLHPVESDQKAAAYQPPLHAVDGDVRVETARDARNHQLPEDQKVTLSPPMVHDLSKDVLSSVEGWRKFHGGNPDTATMSLGRLRPASPKSWMDRPAKVPPQSEEFRTRKSSAPEAEGSQRPLTTVQPKRQRSAQVQGSRAMDDQHRLIAQSEPNCAPWPCLEDAEAVEKPAQAIANQTEPWSQSHLRKASQHKSGVHRDTTPFDLTQWRQKLRAVERTEPQNPSIDAKISDPVLRATSRPRQLSQRRNTCLFCDRTSSTSSTRKETTPCLVVEDGETGRTDHLVVSNTNPYHEHNHLHRGTVESSKQRKLDLKRVEDSISRQASRAGNSGGQAPSTSSRRASLVQRFSFAGGSNTELYHPQPIASTDHTCTWRTRYIDLSSEMEQIRTELKSARNGDSGACDEHSCRDVGIEGLTIVMHMRGKEDLVINTDLTREGSMCEH